MRRIMMPSLAVVAAAIAGCAGRAVTFTDVERSDGSADVARPRIESYYGDHYSRSRYSSRSTKPRNWNAVSAGPRMGALFIEGEAAETLEAEYNAGPILTAWGWQFEYQYLADAAADTPIGLVELVPLVIGLDQGLAIPSANVLIGMRFPSGFEAVAGPNFSPSGVGMCAAIGKTFEMGSMKMPVNFAVVSNEAGRRYSLTFGWNLKQ